MVTAEEHSIIGGLGEAVASVLAEQHPVPMRRVGVRDVYGESGPAVDLLHKLRFGRRRHRSCGQVCVVRRVSMGFVSANQVTIGYTAASRENALHYLSEQAIELGFADDASAVEAAFIARENEAETGLVAGFAVPHARVMRSIRRVWPCSNCPSLLSGRALMAYPSMCARRCMSPRRSRNHAPASALQAAVMLMDAGFRDKVRASTDPVEIAELINSGLED